MASYIGYAARSAMRRPTATTAMSAWLSFLASHILGCRCGGVECRVPSGLWRWSWRQMGETVALPAPMVCVLRAARGAGRLRGA